jgi:hypothetical protein
MARHQAGGIMTDQEIPSLEEFRSTAIKDLNKLKNKYIEMIDLSEQKEKAQNLERAVRLIPGLLKTEEGFLISLSESQRREQLEELLDPLFNILQRVLGDEFERKKEPILAALEAELSKNGSH